MTCDLANLHVAFRLFRSPNQTAPTQRRFIPSICITKFNRILICVGSLFLIEKKNNKIIKCWWHIRCARLPSSPSPMSDQNFDLWTHAHATLHTRAWAAELFVIVLIWATDKSRPCFDKWCSEIKTTTKKSERIRRQKKQICHAVGLFERDEGETARKKKSLSWLNIMTMANGNGVRFAVDADKAHENEMVTQKNADTICQWHIMKIDLIKRMADRKRNGIGTLPSSVADACVVLRSKKLY